MSSKVEKVRINLAKQIDDSYDIIIGQDLFERLASELKAHPLADRYVVISDATVMKLHGNRLTEVLRDAGLKVDRIAFPPGEESKSRKMKQYLEEHLLGLGVGRDGCVIACGGGVTGDLAGFTAATYMRGIPWVMVPTTLLAMVDASIGGKTGIDVPEGKNLIGAFHQPRGVYIDVATLGTLPRRHLVAGTAELIKHAVIADRDFFKLLEVKIEEVLEGDPEIQVEVIKKSCEIKARVVERDEKESDYRRILNYGHTFGHAIEAASGYALLHGEAVSMGMALEGGLSVFKKYFPQEELERQNALLKKAGLPVNPQVVLKALAGRPIRPKDLLEFTRADKKVRKGIVEYALPVKIGKMKTFKHKAAVPIDDKTVLQFLRKVL